MENLVLTSVNVEDLIERISTRVYEKLMQNSPIPEPKVEVDENHRQMLKLLNTPLEKFGLRRSLINHLVKRIRGEDKYECYETLGHVASLTERQVREFICVGKKGISELKELLNNHELHFGMDLSDYQIKPPRIANSVFDL